MAKPDPPGCLRPLNWVLTVVAGLAFVAALATSVNELWFIARADRAVAVVTAVERTSSGSFRRGIGPAYRPTFRFEDRAGSVHEVTPRYRASAAWGFPIGAEIDILYLPIDPGSARPVGFRGVWMIQLVLAATALVAAAMAAVLWWPFVRAARRRRSAR